MYTILAACAGPSDDTAATDDTAVEVTDYVVTYTTDPDPPVAGQEATFTESVRDQADRPIEDLQTAHERVIHTLFISTDLTSFQHLHQEDFEALTAENLRNSTFSFPVTFPMSGDYRVVYDFAHHDQYVTRQDWITVTGEPGQAAEPVLDYSTENGDRDVVATLTWDVEPYAGYEAAWTVHLTDTDGNDITDVTQWLGSDGHAAVVSADLAFTSHTHAWFPGMEDLTPGHPMPQLYEGPDIPFHYTFPTAGAYKMWVQFARTGAPDDPYVIDFSFDVAP
jgi:hypothetical protein